jgi:hypothetical protein
MSDNTSVPRLALRWPDQAAQALGIGPAELEASGLGQGLRRWRVGHVELVAVAELERVLNPPVEDGGA